MTQLFMRAMDASGPMNTRMHADVDHVRPGTGNVFGHVAIVALSDNLVFTWPRLARSGRKRSSYFCFTGQRGLTDADAVIALA
jgi:hypothetical protein